MKTSDHPFVASPGGRCSSCGKSRTAHATQIPPTSDDELIRRNKGKLEPCDLPHRLRYQQWESRLTGFDPRGRLDEYYMRMAAALSPLDLAQLPVDSFQGQDKNGIVVELMEVCRPRLITRPPRSVYFPPDKVKPDVASVFHLFNNTKYVLTSWREQIDKTTQEQCDTSAKIQLFTMENIGKDLVKIGRKEYAEFIKVAVKYAKLIYMGYSREREKDHDWNKSKAREGVQPIRQ